jgi:hypothetical protein
VSGRDEGAVSEDKSAIEVASKADDRPEIDEKSALRWAGLFEPP